VSWVCYQREIGNGRSRVVSTKRRVSQPDRPLWAHWNAYRSAGFVWTHAILRTLISDRITVLAYRILDSHAAQAAPTKTSHTTKTATV